MFCMRRLIFVLFTLLFSSSLIAQQRTGDIIGKVVDTERGSLPGATVTLTGAKTAPVIYVTGNQGLFRFISLAPSNDYKIKAELLGFQTEIIENILITVGKTADLTITMQLGKIEEKITVTAENLVVDKKKVGIGLYASKEIMQNVPTSRDVWAIEEMAPGVYSRYWDVGGSETGSQDGGSAKGEYHHYQSILTLDGIDVTDKAALGSSPSYWDFDTFEEVTVVTGGAGGDITHQTGGMSTNIVTRRAGNNISFDGRFYLTDDFFQADNLTQKVLDAGLVGVNKVRQIKDYGFSFGFPIVKDKAWFYMAYGVQDAKTWNVYGGSDDRLLETYMGKLNLQIFPQNRLEILFHTNKKTQWGIDPSPELPLGEKESENRHFGNPIIKIQDEHMFGNNFFISTKFAWVGKGSLRVPLMDLERQKLAIWNVTDGMWEGSWRSIYMSRPEWKIQFLGTYYHDKLLGASHEIKFGGEYCTRDSISETTYNGNVLARYNYNYPTVDYNGDGTPDIYPNIGRLEVQRGSYRSTNSKAYSAFVGDSITFGKFALNLGLRYDFQYPQVNPIDVKAVEKDNPVWKDNFADAVTNAIDRALPALKIDAIRATASDGSKYSWRTWSPRLGLSWDMTGDGKTILKLFAGSYGEVMGSSEGSTWMVGGTGGYMNFWWLDGNKNGIVDLSELYWHMSKTYSLYRAFDDAGNLIGDLKDAAGIMYGSYDPLNPQKTTAPYTLVDKSVKAPRTLEFMLTFERELLMDFGVSVSATYKKFDNWYYNYMYYPDTGAIESKDWYMSAGTPPASIPGLGDTKEAKDHEWYVLKPEYGYTAWRYRKPQPDYYIDWYGVDIIFNKRLTKRWMFNAGLTWGIQAVHFGDNGYTNPTNIWAQEGTPHQGKPGVEYDSPRWLIKLSGLYQFPYDIDLSFSFLTREGRNLRETFNIVDSSLPNPRSNSAQLFMVPFGSEKLTPPCAVLNLRLQKSVRLRDAAKLYLSVDVFNAFNSSNIHWTTNKDWGVYTVQGATWAPNANAFVGLFALGPRVIRFGLRFAF